MARRISLTVSGGDVCVCVEGQIKVTLSFRRWKELTNYVEQVNKALLEKKVLRVHLGGPYYLHTKRNNEIEEVWISSDPSFALKENLKSGEICLNKEEWFLLLDLMQSINKQLALHLDNIVPCYFSDDHQNQEGMLCCPECNPIGHSHWDYEE